MRSPLDTLHTLIVLSKDPEAKYSPSGENTTFWTDSLWPLRVLMRSPLDTLHNTILLSWDPDAKYSPFGENATLQTQPLWPVRVLMRSPSLLFSSEELTFPLSFPKYTLSAVYPRLYCPLYNKVSFSLPFTSPVLNIFSISLIFFPSSSKILLISSFALFLILLTFWRRGRRLSSLSLSIS